MRATILAVKELDPVVYEQGKSNLLKIRNACSNAPVKIKVLKEKYSSSMATTEELKRASLYIERMGQNISKAIGNEVRSIEAKVPSGPTCLANLLSFNPNDLLKKEAIEYLVSIQKDLENGEFKTCEKKINNLLSLEEK